MLRVVKKSDLLSHADCSDAEFSQYWWKGYTNYLLKSEYPQWINFCQDVFVAFERGNFMTVPAELMHKFGFRERSKVVDISDGNYRQHGDIKPDSQCKEDILDPKAITDERVLWTLSSIRKLIAQYIAFKLYQNKYEY